MASECKKPSISEEIDKNLRLCCVCDSKLFGRSDKVFCDITCKNKYHFELRKHNNLVSNVTIKILNKNYQILCFLTGKNCNKFKVSKLDLQSKGFNFEIVSGFDQSKFGFKVKIYEFSLYISAHNEITVIRNSQQTDISPFVYKRWERFYKKNEILNANSKKL